MTGVGIKMNSQDKYLTSFLMNLESYKDKYNNKICLILTREFEDPGHFVYAESSLES